MQSGSVLLTGIVWFGSSCLDPLLLCLRLGILMRRDVPSRRETALVFFSFAGDVLHFWLQLAARRSNQMTSAASHLEFL